VSNIAIILAAGIQERWGKEKLPKQLVDIAGEPLLSRTVRQVKSLDWQPVIITHHSEILNQYENCVQPDARRWLSETLLSTEELWADKTAILLGDVVWPKEILADVLEFPRYPTISGNYCEIFAATFGRDDKDQIRSAAEWATDQAELKKCQGKMWDVYNALAGFKTLTKRQWNYDVFRVIPSAGTPVDTYTQDFDTPQQYQEFLNKHAWARGTHNQHFDTGLRVVATGTGRCGTGFTGKLLSSAGLLCGHESIFGPKGLDNALRLLKSSSLMAESSWLAAPFLGHDILKNTVIVHLVRHPEKTIQSQMRIGTWGDRPSNNAYAQFHWRVMPDIKQYETNRLARCAYKYVHWNRMIEENAQGHVYIRHNIEDEPIELLKKLTEVKVFEYDDWKDLPLFDNRRYNHVGNREYHFRLHNIPKKLQGPLLETAERYGYEWS